MGSEAGVQSTEPLFLLPWMHETRAPQSSLLFKPRRAVPIPHCAYYVHGRTGEDNKCPLPFPPTFRVPREGTFLPMGPGKRMPRIGRGYRRGGVRGARRACW